MLKPAALSAAALAAFQFIVADRALTTDQRATDMQVVSSDANARLLKLGFKKGVVIDLPKDVKEVLIADPDTVKVIVRTLRRVYVIGASVGRTNIFFYDDGGQEIIALDVSVSESGQPQAPEPEKVQRRAHRDPLSRHFLGALSLSDE